MLSGDVHKEQEAIERQTYLPEESEREGTLSEYSLSDNKNDDTKLHETRVGMLKSNALNKLEKEKKGYTEKYVATNREEIITTKDELNASRWGFFSGNSAIMMDFKNELNSLCDAIEEECISDKFDENVYFYQVGLILEKYDSTIEKANIYLEKRKNPRTENGKKRYEMVRKLRDNLVVEKERFPEAARSLLAQHNMEGVTWSDVTWADALKYVRAFKIPKGSSASNNGADSRREITIERKKYYYKKSEKVSILDGDHNGFFNTKKKIEEGKVVYRDDKDDVIELSSKDRKALVEDGKEKFIAFIDKAMDNYSGEERDDEYNNLEELRGFNNTLLRVIDKLPEESIKTEVLERYLMAIGNFYYSSAEDGKEDYIKLWDELSNVYYHASELENSPYGIADDISDHLNEFIDKLEIFGSATRAAYVGRRAAAAKIDEGSDTTLRNVACSRLASLLGFDDLIAKSTAVVTRDYSRGINHGNIMEKGHGAPLGFLIRRYETVGNQKIKGCAFTRRAADKAVALSIFDYLTGQTNRGIENMLFEARFDWDGTLIIQDLYGIDNDYSFGKLMPEELDGGGYEKMASVADMSGGQYSLMKLNYGEYQRFGLITENDVELKYFFSDCGIRDEEYAAFEARRKQFGDYINEHISEVRDAHYGDKLEHPKWNSTKNVKNVDQLFKQKRGHGVFGVIKEFVNFDTIKVVDN